MSNRIEKMIDRVLDTVSSKTEAKRMTVQELISILQDMDPQGSIFVMGDGDSPVGFINRALAKRYQVTLYSD